MKKEVRALVVHEPGRETFDALIGALRRVSGHYLAPSYVEVPPIDEYAVAVAFMESASVLVVCAEPTAKSANMLTSQWLAGDLVDAYNSMHPSFPWEGVVVIVGDEQSQTERKIIADVATKETGLNAACVSLADDPATIEAKLRELLGL